MSRPTGWDVVGYWGDPVPGDVWEIRALARTYTKIGEAAEDARVRLNSVKGSGWLTAWDADSGDVFIDKIEGLPGDLEKCADSYIELGSTLQTWADDVDDAQYTADKALAEAKDAKEDEATAASSLSGAQSTYNTYNNQVIAAEKLRDKYPDGEGAPSGTKVLTDYQFKALKNNRTVASDRVNELSGDISDASSRVEAAKKLVQEAHGDWTERETATVTAIGKSADAGLGEQSFWDKIFGSEVWETIITVCKIVVAIGGIIVMIIGGPLAWIVLAAALLVLADTLYKMSKGQADGWDLAFALLDCIPGAKGLTTAAGLIGGAAALIKGGKGLLAGGFKLAVKGAASIALKNVKTGLKAAKTSFDSIAKSAGSAKNALANLFKGGDGVSALTVAQQRAKTFMQNKAAGKAFEDTQFKAFAAKYSDAQTQVTIKVKMPDGSTLNTRVDAIGYDGGGNLVIREFKASDTAPLTKNQLATFDPLILNNGGVVTGKGKGLFPGGFVIPPIDIVVIRPSNLGAL